MKTLLSTIQSLGKSVVCVINQTDVDTIISIRPNTVGISDPAVDKIKPLQITMNQTDSEEEVCELILNNIKSALEVVDSIRVYEESVKKADAEKAASKKEQEAKKKLQEEFDKSYKEIKELLSEKTDKDEFNHTKVFNNFKTKYGKDFQKEILETQSMFDKKYTSLDLFSQI